MQAALFEDYTVASAPALCILSAGALHQSCMAQQLPECMLSTCLAQLQVAPAMNTLMWTSPFTHKHIGALCDLGVTVVPPVSKRLACGDTGIGGMADPLSIAAVAKALLELQQQHASLQQALPVVSWLQRIAPFSSARRAKLPAGAFQALQHAPPGVFEAQSRQIPTVWTWLRIICVLVSVFQALLLLLLLL